MSSSKRLASSWVCLLAVALPLAAKAEDEQRPGEPVPVFEMDNKPSPEPAAEPSLPKPRRFALGLAISEHALAAVVARLRIDHLALDASYGIDLIMVNYTKPDGESMGSAAAMSWVHVHGSIVLFFSGDQQRFQNGIRLGSVYDRIASFAGLLGWVGELSFDGWPHFAISFGAGVQVFPRYEQRVRDHFDLDDRVDFTLPLWLQIYTGGNLRWYLF